MSKKKWILLLSHTLVALLVAAITATAMMGFYISRQQGMSKLMILEQLILDRFIGDADQGAMEDAAANAMVGALGDKWSYYIPADRYKAYMEQMQNAYVGIGVTIAMGDDGGIKVVLVTADGPAEEAGILPEDIIVKVNGESIIGMALNDSKKLIQGEENTVVQITVLRGGEEHTMDVTRRTIRTPVVTTKLLEDQIGLVTITNFNRNCANETIAGIEALMAQGAQKLIFDVRNNPGGYASELVKVLDYLLPEGKLFTKVDYTGTEHTDMSDARHLDLPMAVLINGNSYSAAEFFAAAMAEYDAAVVVGEKTGGKGYFQNTYQLPDGSAVGLSTGKYYTPKGKNLEDVGVTPDILIALESDQTEQDTQILAAINALLS